MKDAVRWATLAAWLAVPVPALAQVELETRVYRVATNTELTAVDRVGPGDELRYEVRVSNLGNMAIDAGTLVVTDEIPAGTEYLQDSAAGANTEVSYAAAARQLRWSFRPALRPGQTGTLTYRVRVR